MSDIWFLLLPHPIELGCGTLTYVRILSLSPSASLLLLSGWNGHCWSYTTSTRTLPLIFFATHYGSLIDDFVYHPVKSMHIYTLIDDGKKEVQRS